MQTQHSIQRALISVSDKEGIVEFATQLCENNVEILASGGTATLLKAHHIPVREISDYTDFPEILNGRVKTLHPKIHAGLLARGAMDDATLKRHEIDRIDLLIVNLYPFSKVIKKKECTLIDAIEHIDIGGPTMLRSAAKNYHYVAAVVDPNDYSLILQTFQQNNYSLPLELRFSLAQKIFEHTAQYDAGIAHYLASHHREKLSLFPPSYQTSFQRHSVLRYGENPHQEAAYYVDHKSHGTLADTTLLQGKPLSYNNLIDADCALRLVQTFNDKQAACVIVKHATPCGVAQSDDIMNAYTNAYRCDPESAFGGIIALNHPLDEALARTLIEQQFIEVLLVPTLSTAARTLLKTKPNLRVLQFSAHTDKKTSLALHSISGGLLIQQNDVVSCQPKDMRVVTKREPTEKEWQDLCFAWHVVKFVKSNAIVFAKNEMTVGIGCGQTSRVFATKIAVLRAELAGLSLQDSVMASDAFLPFTDSIALATQNGVRAIIQPGGSRRDPEVIAAADAADISMVFTGIRHFRH